MKFKQAKGELVVIPTIGLSAISRIASVSKYMKDVSMLTNRSSRLLISSRSSFRMCSSICRPLSLGVLPPISLRGVPKDPGRRTKAEAFREVELTGSSNVSVM